MIHPRISVNGICFMGESFAHQAEHWRSLKARRVSVIDPEMEADGIAQLTGALASGDYQLETIVHPYSPAQALRADPNSWVPLRDRLARQIDTAQQLKAKSIYMTTGGRGDMHWEQAAEVFARSIEPCVQQAHAAGIPLMIENAPPQYADLHLAHTLRDTIALASQANIGVCVDLFGCWTEPAIESLLQQAVPLCHLVQVSDYVYGDRSLPARAVPGDGHIPLSFLMGVLLDAGYEGAFDLELVGPRIDAEGRLEATRRAAENVGKILSTLGV